MPLVQLATSMRTATRSSASPSSGRAARAQEIVDQSQSSRQDSPMSLPARQILQGTTRRASHRPFLTSSPPDKARLARHGFDARSGTAHSPERSPLPHVHLRERIQPQDGDEQMRSIHPSPRCRDTNALKLLSLSASAIERISHANAATEAHQALLSLM